MATEAYTSWLRGWLGEQDSSGRPVADEFGFWVQGGVGDQLASESAAVRQGHAVAALLKTQSPTVSGLRIVLFMECHMRLADD